MNWHLFHTWGPWKRYEESGRLHSTYHTFQPFNYTETRQRRSCVVCNKTQDELLKDGPMPKEQP